MWLQCSTVGATPASICRRLAELERGGTGRGTRPHERDWRLAREALAGGPDARREFSERMRCVPKFLVLLRRRRGGGALTDQDLEDVAQETLAHIWRRLDSYEGLASLQTWAYRFCQRTLSTHRRAQQRRSDRILVGGPAEAPEPAAPRQGDYGWVHEQLEHVREPDVHVLRMRHFDGLGFAEIAARLGLSESGVKVAYRRGLERLREQLGRRVAEEGL
jgi:RNA polymerase sigma-70 factor (ECF subfamily)